MRQLAMSTLLACKQDAQHLSYYANLFFDEFGFIAAIAQLGERETEDLKVPGSLPGLGIKCIHAMFIHIRESLPCAVCVSFCLQHLKCNVGSAGMPAMGKYGCSAFLTP